MKSRPVFLLLFLLAALPALSCSRTSGEGPQSWKNYGDALTEGASSRKIILVDVYTDWCGWCKRMDRDVYADPAVADYLENNFVVAKLNAESSAKHAFQETQATEREISKAWGITGYPATVFLSADGEPITIVPGYIPKETFIHVLEYIHTGSYKNVKWEEFLSSKAG